MACGSCGPKTLTVEQMKQMTSEQIIAAYRAGYKLVQGGGAPQQQAMSPNWQYGGQIRSLAGTCPVLPKTGGDTLNLAATATTGVAPYNAKFYKDVTGTIAVPNRVQIGVLSTPAGLAIAADGGTANDTYVLTDLDASSANFDGTLGNIQLIATITDSCPTGAQTCEQTCTLSITCAAPTCSFVVT